MIDKEWLKEEMGNVLWRADLRDALDSSDGNLIYDEIVELIDQVEEPESEKRGVLQNFIQANQEMSRKIEELESKNKKPVIPKFVAEQLDYWNKNEMNILWIFFIREVTSSIEKWLEEDNKNYEKILNAIKYGYEVEKEPKYYVDLETAAYVAKWKGDGSVQIYTDAISGNNDYVVHLTEKEIKDYDCRFWQFAEEVTE